MRIDLLRDLEPTSLSISASIAGLITIADTAFRRTFRYIKAVKDAPKKNPVCPRKSVFFMACSTAFIWWCASLKGKPSTTVKYIISIHVIVLLRRSNNAQQTAALLRRWAKVDSANKGVVEEIQALASDADHSVTPKGLARPDFASVPSRTIATDSCSSLRIAAEFGHLSIVRTIIQDDIHEIDAVDKSTGRTSLRYAAKAGHVEVVQQLLERGADCNARDKKGKTALHYSVRRETSQCLTLLLQQGIDIGARDFEGSTVWHSAARRNNAKAVIGFSTRTIQASLYSVGR